VLEIGHRSPPKRRRDSGQALVEFALSLAVLLLLIFAVVEGGRMLHAWITLQSAAREGGRYAITGQYEERCLSATPACPDARVWSITRRVQESTTGLAIDPSGGYGDPKYLRVEVSGIDKDNVWQSNYAGLPGRPVMVRAIYYLPLVTPLLRPIAESVRLTGQVVVNNENYAQVNQSDNTVEIGDLPPPPPPSIPVADLQIEKSATPLVSLIDQPITFRLQVTNHGPDEARGVEVVDTLPPEVTLLSSAPTGVCEQSAQVLTCRVPNLPRGVQYDIVLTVRAPAEPPPAPGAVVNRATVSGAEKDDDLSNNEAKAQSLVVLSDEVSDLTILSIDDSPDPVVINQRVTYTVLVRNNGISDATDVEVNNDLPAGFTFVSAAVSGGSGCEDSGGVVICRLGDIISGETAWADVTVTAASSPGSATYTARVSATQVDPDERNNVGSEATTISPEWSDLYVTMSDRPDPALVEGEITYAIRAGNNGPSDARNVILVDTLPDGVGFVSASGPQGDCAESGGRVTCDLGVLLRNQEVSVEIVVEAVKTGTIVNQVAISAQQTDPNPVNDQATTVTTVAPSADLEISIKADPRTPPGVRAGTLLTYRLTVLNGGPSLATNVEVIDKLPVDASFLRVLTEQGTCEHLGETVECFLGNVASGDSVDLTIEMVPELEGVIVNTATVSGRQADVNLGNNTATDTTTVLAPSTQFITLQPTCGDPGSMLTVRGFNWPSEGRKEVEVYWDAVERGNLIGTVTDNGSSWILDLIVPAGAIAGTHTVIADRQRDVAEATFTVPCPAPNLTTTQPQLLGHESLPLSVGDPATFQVEISNDGQLDAVNQFFVSLYFDPPLAGGSSQTHISQNYRVELVAVSWLAAGESRVVTISEENGFDEPGMHEVYVVVDSDPAPTGLIKELSELDNISPVLTVEVAGSPAPTPTPGPTPTATPVFTEPASLIGQAFLSPLGGQPLPQAGVEVAVYDVGAGSLEKVAYTDIEGSYFLTDLAPGVKTVSACIIIDDIAYAYTATGVELLAGQITFKDLFLEEGLCH
jgi:uncharacterized repeat protein (TIGR01451 family)